MPKEISAFLISIIMIIDENIQEYIEIFNSKQSELLDDLVKETYQKTVLPQMISGAYQGRLLSLLSKIIRPKNILEVGTFTGFATLCLAEGLSDAGIIHTIDKNDEFVAIQNKYFKKSGFREKIKQYLGNAREIIPQMTQKFDLVFIDADKRYYPEYFEMILPKMNKGGIILADNVLWYGKVADADAKDAETNALKKYNKILAKDSRVEVLILPVRDGISMARVK
jgi:predicted O-methyltransferase YrrM